jgi:alkylhydroperoxidase family enzyme
MDVRRAVGAKVGIPEAKLGALDAYEESPWFSERERAALAFCQHVTCDHHDVSDASTARLRAHFSEPECIELMFIVGFQIFVSKFAKAFRLPPQVFSS